MDGDKITPTPVEATKNATAEALDALDGGAPAEPTAQQTEPTPEAKAEEPKAPEPKTEEPDNTVSAEEAEAAAKAAKTPAEEDGKQPEPAAAEDEEDDLSFVDKKDWKVPGHKFSKKVSENKDLKSQLAEKDAKIAELEASKQSKKADEAEEIEGAEEELTPAALKALREQGYVTKQEIDDEIEQRLADREQRIAFRQQIRQDFANITTWAEKNGYPKFVPKDVVAYAEKEWGDEVVLTGKNLKAAYQIMHSEAITDAQVKAQLATAGKTATAETPRGASSAPAAAVPAGGSSGEGGSWKDRVTEVVDSSDK